MTTQFTDACLIDGVEQPLWPSPLDPVLRALHLTSVNVFDHCTACWRGYVARWELRDEALYLLAVDHWQGDCVRVDFATFDELGMHERGTDVVLSQHDPWGVLKPLPEACLMRVKGWLAGDRVAPLSVDWMVDAGGATQRLVRGGEMSEILKAFVIIGIAIMATNYINSYFSPYNTCIRNYTDVANEPDIRVAMQ